MTAFEKQMESLYGPLAPFSEYSIGDVIAYRLGNDTYTGKIVYVVAPEQLLTEHLHLRYVVEPAHRAVFPDYIWQTDIIVCLICLNE